MTSSSNACRCDERQLAVASGLAVSRDHRLTHLEKSKDVMYVVNPCGYTSDSRYVPPFLRSKLSCVVPQP